MAMPVAHLGRPAWRHSSVEGSGGQALLDITLYLPGDAFLPCLISEHLTEQAFTHGIEETGSGLQHVVNFVNLPGHVDLALQAIGECVRIPGAWAAVGGVTDVQPRCLAESARLLPAEPLMFRSGELLQEQIGERSSRIGLRAGFLFGAVSVLVPAVYLERHSFCPVHCASGDAGLGGPGRN